MIDPGDAAGHGDLSMVKTVSCLLTSPNGLSQYSVATDWQDGRLADLLDPRQPG